jgi:hypothetical protein
MNTDSSKPDDGALHSGTGEGRRIDPLHRRAMNTLMTIGCIIPAHPLHARFAASHHEYRG